MPVIKLFRHSDLKELYEEGRLARVAQGSVANLLRILTALDRSSIPIGMDIPALGCIH